jgi:hypothetical protein
MKELARWDMKTAQEGKNMMDSHILESKMALKLMMKMKAQKMELAQQVVILKMHQENKS